MGKFLDLTGKKFSRLTVLKQINNIEYRSAYLCRCDCGKNCVILAQNLKSGHSRSCGCYSSEVHRELSRNKLITHGLSHNQQSLRIYRIWKDMKRRCNNKNRKDYIHYGGRGIKVCQEWNNDFLSFYNWAMANGYKDNMTIERINVNDGYNPENCCWILKSLQTHNTRATLKINAFGFFESAWWWSEKTGLNYLLIKERIKNKMPVELALMKGNSSISARTIRDNLIKAGILQG